MELYGLPDQEDMDAVLDHVAEIRNLYKKHNLPVLAGDNMLVAVRTMSFLQDKRFVRAVDERIAGMGSDLGGGEPNKVWRLHTYVWCCKNALALVGDLVECGVHMGLYSGVMLSLVDLVAVNKKIYMYDTFTGLDENYSNERERKQTAEVYQIPDWEQTVRDSLAKWPHAIVVKGTVPDSLEDTAPDKVAFLHLDMNAAEAEVAALNFFEERLTPGAIILLDDFGRLEHVEIFLAMKAWFDDRYLPILELPTGQGLVVWRP